MKEQPKWRALTESSKQEETVDFITPLTEVVVKAKFLSHKSDLIARCDKAGIKTHLESRKEYEAKRASQQKDAASTGTDAERYGRTDRLDNVVLDPGVQIAQGKDVKIENFRRDLELSGFKLVGLEVFQGFGKPVNEFFFTATYAKDDRPKLELTIPQQTLLAWFFARTFGNVYVWRNFNGKQLDIPVLGIRQGDVDSIELRIKRDGRELTLGNTKVEVAFKGDESTVNA